MRVSDKVSQVSAIPFVREAMVAQQQALGKTKGSRNGRPGYRNDRFS